jgi:hypothetical protein
MSRIIIVNSIDSLEKHLQKSALPEKSRKKYVLMGEANGEEIIMLEGAGFLMIPQPDITEYFRAQFLREYVDLIGVLGKTCNSREWWATDIASKNRFTSKLPFLMHQLHAAVEAVKNNECDCLIIFKPEWSIVSSLNKIFSAQNHDVTALTNKWTELINVVMSRLRNVLFIFYRVFKTSYYVLYIKAKMNQAIRERMTQTASFYVVKTFIYDHSFSETGDYRDAFFGSLPDFLKEKNKSVLIYAVVAGNFKRCLEKIKNSHSYPIISVEMFLSLADILRAAYYALFCRIAIKKEALFFGYDVKELINNELLQTFNGIPFYQFLHYWSAKKLFSKLSVETFLMTCENNPWEKMCILAAREYSPDTTIIGYQHTVVPQSATNMFSSLNDRDVVPTPDKILTVGEAPKQIMERYGNYEKGTIEPACGLRFEYLFNVPLTERRRTNTILVALEGVVEVYKMTNYAYNQLKGSPYTVVIRTHPVLPIKRLRHNLVKGFGSCANFQISMNRTLKQDIESADMVMYWGSTVGMEALSMGKPVIHFHTESVLSYDPLFECKHLKWVVSESDSLQKIVEAIYSLPDDDFFGQQKNAKSYLRSYFHPVTEERLQKFVS